MSDGSIEGIRYAGMSSISYLSWSRRYIFDPSRANFRYIIFTLYNLVFSALLYTILRCVQIYLLCHYNSFNYNKKLLIYAYDLCILKGIISSTFYHNKKEQQLQLYHFILLPSCFKINKQHSTLQYTDYLKCI